MKMQKEGYKIVPCMQGNAIAGDMIVNSLGQKLIYGDAADLQWAVDVYFCHHKKDCPTLKGMAYFLGFSDTSYFYRMCKRGKDFEDVVIKARKRIAAQKELFFQQVSIKNF